MCRRYADLVVVVVAEPRVERVALVLRADLGVRGIQVLRGLRGRGEVGLGVLVGVQPQRQPSEGQLEHRRGRVAHHAQYTVRPGTAARLARVSGALVQLGVLLRRRGAHARLVRCGLGTAVAATRSPVRTTGGGGGAAEARRGLQLRARWAEEHLRLLRIGG